MITRFFFIIFLSNLTYSQDRKVELDTMKIDGYILIDKMVIETQEIEEDEETDEEKIEDKQKTSKDINKKLEDLENRVNVDELDDPPEEKTVEVTPVKETPKKKRAYDFLFDNSKPAVFKTKTKWRNFKLGAGVFSFSPNRYQETGKGGEIGIELVPAIGLGLEFGSESKFSYQLDSYFSFPTTSEDELMSEFRFGLEFAAYYKLLSFLRPFVGSTVYFNMIKSKETKIEKLPGNQGTFFSSASLRSSINNSLDVGAEFLLDRFSVDLKVGFLSLFDSQKRDVHYGLMLNYYFDFSKKNKSLPVEKSKPTEKEILDEEDNQKEVQENNDKLNIKTNSENESDSQIEIKSSNSEIKENGTSEIEKSKEGIDKKSNEILFKKKQNIQDAEIEIEESSEELNEEKKLQDVIKEELSEEVHE